MEEEKENERRDAIEGAAENGEYCFYLDAAGMTAKVSADGKTIEFFANGGRVRMGVPFSEGRQGYSVRYALTPLENDVYLLRVTVDRPRYNAEEKELAVTARPPV